MKDLIKYICMVMMLCIFTQCSDYLDTTNDGNIDDSFVTSSVSETRKTLSWCYGYYRQNCVGNSYIWNDPFGSDAEYWTELNNAGNSSNARLRPEEMGVNSASGGFNNLYVTLARCAKIAALIAEKDDYKSAVAAGTANDWTQMYGECMTLWALCYFDLAKNFGDVPYGYENTYVDDGVYELASRFVILDNVIATLKSVEPLMYPLGTGWVTAESVSRTFACAMIGKAALYAAGWQTIRTDVSGLYGNIEFTKKGNEENGCVYARRNDTRSYYETAETYFAKAMGEAAGTVQLITVDARGYNNPFQRHFQYLHDLKVSPESVFELGNKQGNSIFSGSSATSITSEYGYAWGRPSSGATNAAYPPKAFGAARIVPVFYYEWDPADRRRDVSVCPTGCAANGTEKLIPFKTGFNTAEGGGLTINKWDQNRQNPPYTTTARQTGINYLVMRLADVILMQAEVKAELGKDEEARNLANQVRQRGYNNGETYPKITSSGDALKEDIYSERKYEFLGEGQIRRDMIRSGKFSEKAMAVRAQMTDMINGIRTDGKYVFTKTGHEISDYIYTKMVQYENPLTFECTDTSDPVLFPGWRGIYNFTAVTAKERNLAIKGLFEYIPVGDPSVDGYSRVAWGSDIAAAESAFKEGILGGISSENTPPRYYWPIPSEVIVKSKGKVTNGYGLPSE